MSEHNLTIAKRFYEEVVSRGDLGLIDEFVSDDYVEHEVLPGLPTDKEAPRAFVEMMRAAFPDVAMTPLAMVAHEDEVWVHGRVTGTHQGEFLGIPATNKEIDIEIFDRAKFRDGKVIAHWGLTDTATMMVQLGVMEAPSA